MTPISTFNLTVSDRFIPDDASTTCTAVPATDIYGTGKKTYINIGSGNVFRLFWEAPALTNDTIDYYKLVIKRHDTTLNAYYDIFDKNIGLVNEFYVDSALLPALPLQYMLSIYVAAYGKRGSIVTSNIENPYISKGTGTYVKVTPAGYQEAIWKRALAFVEAPATDTIIPAAVLDEYGNTVHLLDNDGNEMPLTAANILSSDDWNVALEYYVKDDKGAWKTSDISYEILVDKDGYIITDNTDMPIYTL